MGMNSGYGFTGNTPLRSYQQLILKGRFRVLVQSAHMLSDVSLEGSAAWNRRIG